MFLEISISNLSITIVQKCALVAFFLCHGHHVVEGLVEFFGDASVVHLLVHQSLQKSVDGGFQFVDGSLGELSAEVKVRNWYDSKLVRNWFEIGMVRN